MLLILIELIKRLTIRRIRRSFNSLLSRLNPFQRTNYSQKEYFESEISILDQLLMASTGPQASTVPAICGFDIGSENCYVGVARAGGIEIVLNEYSQRSTPAYVGFGQNQRELGVSAKLKHLMNISNTCFSPNRIIGKQSKELSEEFPFQLEPTPNGEIAVRVWHNGEEQSFTAVQVMAMVLTKLRQVSSNSVDCVLNCPNYYTDSQRRSLMDAAIIAGLNPIRVIPDTTAIALYYGFYRTAPTTQDLTIAAFVDCGHSSTQCSVVMFNHKENQMKVLSVESEMSCGGKHLDEILANYFIEQQNLKLNKRSRFRLIAECEKLKKQMSANSNELPLNVECLYDEKDFTARIDRTLFEELSQPFLSKLNDIFTRAVTSATNKFNAETGGKLGEFRIDVCEIVGGTSRIPAIKRMVRNVFGVEVTTTLNADEAVSRGCALQCAILSPTFKVARQLNIIDYAPFQIDFRYWHQSDAGNESDFKSVRSLFPIGSQVPFTKQVSITCQSLPMIAAFDYKNESNQLVPIGEYKIFSNQNIQINKNQLKVRIRLDPNGLVVIHSVTVTIENSQSTSKKNSNNENQTNVENIDSNSEQNSSQAMDTEDTTSEDNKDSEDQKELKNNKKSKSVSIDLQVEPIWIRGKLSDNELLKYREIESNLILADKNWKEKTDAKNALEEYIYEWREKLEGGGYDPFVEDNEKQVFLKELKSGEQWLYEQEDNEVVHSKSVYEERLNKMKDSFSDDVLYRKREFETRPSLLEQLGKHLQQSRKLMETAEEVEKESIKKLQTEIEMKQKWLDQTFDTFNTLKTTSNPTINCEQIRQQIDSIDSLVRNILSERNRRQEDKRRQAEAAKQTPPAPTPDQNQKESKEANQVNSDSPQMEVDDDIHPTL